MIPYFKQFVASPIFEADEEKTSRARVLNSLLLSIAAILMLHIAINVPFFVVNKLGASGLIVLALGLLLFIRWLMRRGQVLLASLFLIVGFWVVVTFVVVFSGAVTSITPSFFLVLIVLAGLLLGQNAAIGMAVLSSVTTLGLVVLVSNGYYLPRLFPLPGTSGWMTLTLSFVIALIPLNLVLRSRAEALAQARQELAERRRTEAALRQSEARLRTIINQIPFDLWVCDAEGRYIMQNAISLELVGNQVGKTVDDLELPPELLAEYKRRHRQALSGQIVRQEIEELVKGRPRTLDSIQHPIRDSEQILGFIGMQIDITERKQAEEALRRSEERYRNFIEQSSEGIWMLAFDEPIPLDLPPEEQVRRIQSLGYLAECNDAQARMYGYTSSRDVIGVRLLQHYGDYREVNFQATLKLVQDGYRSSNRETREVTASGETVYFLNNAVGVIEQGQLVALWGTQQDITPLKQAEAEREKLIADLEAKNAELERFTYTVSHDLKSPLVTINGFLGWLEKDIQAGKIDRVKADINRIREAADKMRGLLDELLELSRIGRLVNPPEAAPFETIVREALALVKGQLARRGVTVEVAAALPVVCGDRTRLVEVVQNLVDNAAKFMGDQPEPRIEIGVREQAGEQIFFVRDNGIGIAPKYHEKVFGLFDKLDPHSEGSGIGLALVRRIVEVHGGRIWVESDGHGSTFCFTLPNSDTAAQDLLGGNDA